MTWFKIDDGFWSHPKVLELSDSAIALWVRAGAYSCNHLTDGRVTDGACKLLAGSVESAQELVSAGLWKATRGGYVFHDWAEYQETSETVITRREQAKERKRKSRESRTGHTNVTRDNSVTPASVTPVSRRESQDTRPDPAIKETRAHETDGIGRLDVKKLVDALVEHLNERNVRRPASLSQWHRQAKQLLDDDQRPLDEALAVLRFSQTDPFWSKNILTMAKLREKYDQLRLAGDIQPHIDPEQILAESWEAGRFGKIQELTGWMPPPFRHPEDPTTDRDEAFRQHFRQVIDDNRDELLMRLREVNR